MPDVGEWSKAEAQEVYECVDEMFKALPKKKQMEFLGHLNEILCFVSKAKEKAPENPE